MVRSRTLDYDRKVDDAGWPSDGYYLDSYHNVTTTDNREYSPDASDDSMQAIRALWGEAD